VAAEPFYVAIITPVIHYCMGGLEVTADAEVISKTGVIPGLYAAGEMQVECMATIVSAAIHSWIVLFLAALPVRLPLSTSMVLMASSSSAHSQRASKL